MNKKISLKNMIVFSIVICIVTAGLTLFISQRYFNGMVHFVKEREAMYEKVALVDKELRDKFYFDIDEEKLIDGMVKGYVSGTGDKYTRYLTQEEYEKQKIDNAGEKVGAGISVLLQDNGYYRIETVFENSAADQAGVVVGDLMVAVNGIDVSGKDDKEGEVPFDIFKELQGEVGTKVSITVQRDDKEIDFVLKRKMFEIVSVTSKMIEDVGYIKIDEFNINTYDQFNIEVDKLIKDGAKGLIFDLRDNGGGILNSCYKMIDKLVPAGEIASSVDNKDNKKVLATSKESQIDLPMVILANGGTASASELFTAAMLDFDKAEVVGAKTFGKGILQQLIPLGDGTAVNLTTDAFLPPSGVSFHGIGIEPTYEVDLTDEQIEKIDPLDEKTDPQLIKALEVVKLK